MNVLVINAGSSSLKYQLFDMDKKRVLAKGLCERIGLDGRIKHTTEGKGDYAASVPMKNHAAAIQAVIDVLTGKEYGAISSMKDIGAVGHRIVHGGEFFSESALVNDETIKAIKECIPLAPLHNPGALTGIEACISVMGDTPQVVVFDTAFHQTMPEVAYMYAVPYKYYTENKVRRYGFHGTSHRYVSTRCAEMLGRPIEELKIITCHLGNGSSIAAVKNGKVVDTTMGFTPLDGLPMGTRSGSIDPAIVGFIADAEHKSASEVIDILNKESGVLGVSGLSSDFRDLDAAAKQGNKRAQLAMDMFVYSVKKYIGAYAAAMGGVDAIVFTAGVGENNSAFREEMCEGLGYMGVAIDEEKNSARGEAIISSFESKVKVLVIPTNEELVIAQDTVRLVAGK